MGLSGLLKKQLPQELLQNHSSFESQGANANPARDVCQSVSSVTPYLGLRARLSQIWLNRWTVLLLLVLVRLVIVVNRLRDEIGDAQIKALSACSKVEGIGSAIASLPYYLSFGVNDLVANGISQTIRGLVELLGMILAGTEELILFVINFYIGTYVCLSSALVHGGLDMGIGAADETAKLTNDAIGGITATLLSDVSGVQDKINAAFSSISSASSFFGKSITPPTIDLSSSINDLKTIHVDDTTFVTTLQALNRTVPTYDQVENTTKSTLTVSFDAVRDLLNSTYGRYTFNTSMLPVAKKEALTFCSGNNVITDFFAGLRKAADAAKTRFIVVLMLLAILACVPMTWLEIRRWHSQQRLAKMLAQHSDQLDAVYTASRPYTAAAGIKIASKFRPGQRQLLARWAIAYGTSLPALFVLSLATTGFFSCICQAILLRAVQQKAPGLASQIDDFTDSVVSTLEHTSTQWASDSNGVLLRFQSQVNDDLLKYVVNATTAVNDTLNVFMSEISEGINAYFNGTVLENTVQQIVRCLIGIKIDTIETGLTWVHDHAHVTLPQFPNDTFAAGAAESISNDTSLRQLLADPDSAVKTDDITAAVDKVVASLRSSLTQDALIATVLFLVYVLVVLVGVLFALLGMMRPDRAQSGQKFSSADVRGENAITSKSPEGKGILQKGHSRRSSHGYIGDAAG